MSLEFIRFNLSIIKVDRYGNGIVIHKYILTSILLLSMYVCHVTHLHISLHIYTKALQKHVVHTYITCQLSTADFIFLIRSISIISRYRTLLTFKINIQKCGLFGLV